MAKKVRVAGKVTIKDMAVVESLTWLLKEIKAELEEFIEGDIRLLAIKHEVKRLLRKYDIAR